MSRDVVDQLHLSSPSLIAVVALTGSTNTGVNAAGILRECNCGSRRLRRGWECGPLVLRMDMHEDGIGPCPAKKKTRAQQ